MVIALICVLGCAFFTIKTFFNLPTDKQISNIKEWLKYAVTEAEKMFEKGGMGNIKLRYVYDMAINKFPWIAELVPFQTFSEWVDEALEWMKNQLNSNTVVNNYVNGGDGK